MKRQRRLRVAGASTLLLLPLTFGMLVHTSSQASAQILPDGTVGTLVNASTTTPCVGGLCSITGGTAVGGNLFHSFSQFSVPAAGNAQFNTPAGIQNIISRVTGGILSTIDGQISGVGASPNANLFLINPSGIVFGAGASLSLGGSFIASTANSLRFSDGSEFSAVNPSASPLLTVSVPLGLQYGPNPGRIAVEGPGNDIFVVAPPFEIVRAFRPPGLQVQPGQTLALVGGDLLLQGGNLTAEAGRVELGSVTGGTVTLTPTSPGWSLNYQGIQNFGDIRLSQAASADTSGINGGVIQVQGRNVSLTDGSSLLTLTTGAGTGGQLNIHATDSVTVSGSSFSPMFGPLFPSSLLTEVDLGATGSGGNLSITTGRLTVTDGAKVSVSTSGSGPGGNLNIQAQTVELARSSEFFGPSQLAADASNSNSGQGGNIIVNANRVLLNGGGWITAVTSGVGDGGTIRVNAQSIELTGGSADPVPGAIFAQVNQNSSGNGGNIFLETNRLQVSDGGQVATSTFGLGNAGRLQIFSQAIEVTGGTSLGPSGLFSVVNPGSSGQGGNLEITAGRLGVADGAQVAADTLGDGNAGNLIVNAQTVELSGFNAQGRSGLFAGAIIGSGTGGDLSVTADRLTIRNGATVSVSNFSSSNPNTPQGQGAAGNAQINARFIQLDRGSTLTAASAGGDKGNIFLNSQVIELRRGSSISTNALGNATGGNISINTDFIVAVQNENSDITANAVNNFGGRVIINATGIFGIEFRSQITPFSDITASSDLGPLFSGIVEIRTPGTDPTRGVTQLPSGLVDADNRIAAACERSQGNTFLVTGRGGLPEDASQALRGESVWSDLRLGALPSQNSPRTVAPSPRAGVQPSLPAAIVEAQGWVKEADGQITLVVQAPSQPGAGSWDKPVECRQLTSTATDSNSLIPLPQALSAGSVK